MEVVSGPSFALFVNPNTNNLAELETLLTSFALIQELIPIILCSAIHHPETKERDNLLHMLFNLIKRPDEDQR